MFSTLLYIFLLAIINMQHCLQFYCYAADSSACCPVLLPLHHEMELLVSILWLQTASPFNILKLNGKKPSFPPCIYVLTPNDSCTLLYPLLLSLLWFCVTIMYTCMQFYSLYISFFFLSKALSRFCFHRCSDTDYVSTSCNFVGIGKSWNMLCLWFSPPVEVIVEKDHYRPTDESWPTEQFWAAYVLKEDFYLL